MGNRQCQVVTGAFGYTGRYITHKLLERGVRVRTLTNSRPVVDPFLGEVEVHPLTFDEPERLTRSLAGAEVLYNTYWVRFNYKSFSYARAIENTLRLFDAASAAGVERMVHVSITNPSEDSPFEYFRGKAKLEGALKSLGISYAILRPAVFFGRGGILINNIAWVLRNFPVFGVFGDGGYGIQPIHVEDFAGLAIEAGQKSENLTLDMVGPEAFTFRELVETLGKIIGCPRPVIGIPPRLAWLVGKVMGLLTRDVMITWEEIGGLMAGLLTADSPPLGTTCLTDWARKHRDTLGTKYASELARRRVQ
jgi:uncharacterized protein YbjT (DUF2867 family)